MTDQNDCAKDIVRGIIVIILIVLAIALFSCTKEIIYEESNKQIINVDSTIAVRPNPLDSVTDIIGITYHTMKYGSQTWMIEDLNTTRYNNGVLINDTIRGMYSYYTITVGNLCPLKWHVPQDWEWRELTDYFTTSKKDTTINTTGYWWSATGYNSSEAWQWYKNEEKALIFHSVVPKERYLHIRCIKD